VTHDTSLRSCRIQFCKTVDPILLSYLAGLPSARASAFDAWPPRLAIASQLVVTPSHGAFHPRGTKRPELCSISACAARRIRPRSVCRCPRRIHVAPTLWHALAFMKSLLCPTPQTIPVLLFGTVPHLIMGLPIGRSDTLVACTHSCGSGTPPCLALFSHVRSKTPSLFALVFALAACNLPHVRPGWRIVRRQVLGRFVCFALLANFTACFMLLFAALPTEVCRHQHKRCG